jgi:RNA polymerase sigma-32 factor
VVPDQDNLDPEQRVAGSQLGELVREKLRAFEATLDDDRERAIWRERLMAHDPASLSEIGDRYKVSKERIRQIQARIEARLKTYLQDQLGDEMAFDFDVPDDG